TRRSMSLANFVASSYDPGPMSSRSVPRGGPEGRDGRPRRRSAAIFKVGDLVTSPSREDWRGEVVAVSRLGNGFVTVRWRTSAGTSLQSMEERVDHIARGRCPHGGRGDLRGVRYASVRGVPRPQAAIMERL